MLILIDQDNVLADFERGFHDAWVASGHPHPALPLHERRSFYLRDDYPEQLRRQVEAIYTAPGFFRDLPPMAGAVEALTALQDSGYDLRICTSPLSSYRNCLSEKYEWVECHLGMDFVSRVIMTKDKTLVHGDILIDDKPEVTGVRTPDWRQIIFDQPYNRHVGGVRMTWANWKSVLPFLS